MCILGAAKSAAMRTSPCAVGQCDSDHATSAFPWRRRCVFMGDQKPRLGRPGPLQRSQSPRLHSRKAGNGSCRPGAPNARLFDRAATNLQRIDGPAIPVDFEVPRITRLKIALNVAGKPRRLDPGGVVVRQVRATVILERGLAPEMKEIFRHFKAANAGTESPFLCGFAAEIVRLKLGDAL